MVNIFWMVLSLGNLTNQFGHNADLATDYNKLWFCSLTFDIPNESKPTQNDV